MSVSCSAWGDHRHGRFMTSATSQTRCAGAYWQRGMTSTVSVASATRGNVARCMSTNAFADGWRLNAVY